MTNSGTLKLTTQHAVFGSFAQTASGALVLDIGGTGASQYGSLTFTSPTSTVTLGGILGLDLVGGFSLAIGDVFDIMNGFAGLSGDFAGLTLGAVSAGVSRSRQGHLQDDAALDRNNGGES